MIEMINLRQQSTNSTTTGLLQNLGLCNVSMPPPPTKVVDLCPQPKKEQQPVNDLATLST